MVNSLVNHITKLIHEKFACLFTCGKNEVSIKYFGHLNKSIISHRNMIDSGLILMPKIVR